MLTRLSLPQDGSVRIIGQISTLVPTKGQMVLLDAAPELLALDPSIFIVLVGYVREDSPYREALERKCVELGIRDRVRIVSYPGPIGDVWQVIDIHVHPSQLDSLPNTIMEGMSLRKPAVVTSVGGIPSLVKDRVTGLVVPPGDSTALSKAIATLLSNPALCASLGAAAFARYIEGYTREIMTRRLEDLFELLVSTKMRSDAYG